MTTKRIASGNYRVVGHSKEALAGAFVELAKVNASTGVEIADAEKVQRLVLEGTSVHDGRMSSAEVEGQRILFRYAIDLKPEPTGFVIYGAPDNPLADTICEATARQWDELAKAEK